MSFNLINKLFNFQQYINNLFINYLNKLFVIYINNIIIYLTFKEKYIKYIIKVLINLNKAKLQVNLKEYKFYIT